MSATNHTTNYNLPQFVGTDKPTWLTDVNGALLAIDTQMKTNADSASSAGSTATTVSTNLGVITNLNTTDKTSAVNAINEVNTNLGTVSTVASGASGTATLAKNEVDALSAYLTLTKFGDITPVATSGTITAGNINTLHYALNNDGTFGKVYGEYRFTITSSAGCTLALPIADLGATSDFTINCMGMRTALSGSSWNLIRAIDGNVDYANKRILISFNSSWYNNTVTLAFYPCCYFFKDFGDTPTPE